MLIIIFGQSKPRLSYKKNPYSTPTEGRFSIKLTMDIKISGVPSPRNPAVYKTNLTNRHENNFLMSDTKIMIFNQTQNFLKNFNNIAGNH